MTIQITTLLRYQLVDAAVAKHFLLLFLWNALGHT